MAMLRALPSGIRYVITLDADTRLPIGAARRLVGKMAHPLNRPHFDPHAGLVVQGHGMLQPRVTPSLPIGSEGSLFQRAFSGPNGLDPYALAVSDVYQDLFEEGSYCGKGIYEVDIFEAALEGQIPENSVLSHDLLEGIFARAGLASDIEVVEEFPSRYAVAAARQHRWVRGDWQLLALDFRLSPQSPRRLAENADPVDGPLEAARQSAPLALGAGRPSRHADRLAAADDGRRDLDRVSSFSTIALPPLLPAIAGIVPHRAGVSLRNHLRTLRGDFALGLLQSAFLITFLAHQAWVMVDAVVRTLFRLFIRRRHLLEWVTAAQTTAKIPGSTVAALALQIAASLASAGCCRDLVLFLRAAKLADRGAVRALVGAVAARRALGEPAAACGRSFVGHAGGRPGARLVARRTWRFFEKFVTAEDNMLPPDNFQEDPEPVIAHRTSPTNIGLYLLSVVAARDFGWLGTLDALERLEATFATMAKLERFRGHFYNWYDTSDLRALEPKYVSSVDSGNLAGHLIALGNACREIAAGPIGNQNWISGLR